MPSVGHNFAHCYRSKTMSTKDLFVLMTLSTLSAQTFSQELNPLAPTEDAPAEETGVLYEATSQALSNAAHNATSSQQQTALTEQAATTEGVATLYSIDTATTGTASAEILAEPAAPEQEPGTGNSAPTAP